MAQENENNGTPIELTLDELAFVNAYFECNMNGTRAYMKLHPKVTYESAKATASVVLTNLNVRAEVKRRLNEGAMSVEEALYRVGVMARAELMPFIRVDDDGFTYFNFSDPDAQEYMWLIKEMETKRERRIEGQGKGAEEWEGEWVRVKLVDAQAALRDILKMHGKFVDKVALTDPSGTKQYEPKVDDERFDRAVSTLANALGEIISGTSAKQDGKMDTPK